MHNLFTDFGLFLAAVAQQYVALAAGCAVTVAIDLVAKHWLKRPLSYREDVAILCGFLFLACFLAWQSEETSVTQVQSKLNDANDKFLALTSPNLHGSVDSVLVAPAGEKEENSIVTVSGILKNTGAPSIADSWQMTIKLPNGQSFTGVRYFVPQSIALHSEKGGPTIHLSTETIWPRVSSIIPIPTGGAAEGWLSNVFLGVKKSDIMQRGTPITVTCKDVTGHDIAITYDRMGLDPPPMDGATLQKGEKITR